MSAIHIWIFILWVCYGYELYWKYHNKIEEKKEHDELYRQAKDAMEQYKGGKDK